MQMMMMMMGTATTALVNNMAPRDHRRPKLSSEGSSPSPPHQHAMLPMKRKGPIDYPGLREWLMQLEQNPRRNKHSEPFSTFADVLVDTHKLYTIDDLVTTTGHELSEVGKMEFGTASRILRYAKEDVAALENPKKPRLSY
jgi:hypothetical protein